MTNDPHEGDSIAVYEDETPVPVGGLRPTTANIVSAVCRESNPDAYLLFLNRGDTVPYDRVLLQVTMFSCSRGCALSFAGGPIAQFEDIRLLGPTFVGLPAQAFYVKKAVVTVVTRMAPSYAVGGGGAEKFVGPFDILDDHSEEVKVCTLVHLPYLFFPIAMDQKLTPRLAWAVLVGVILSEGGGGEAQYAPLLSFLRAAAVEGSAIPFETVDLEVVAPDKALEAQPMEILRRELPARFEMGASGGLSL